MSRMANKVVLVLEAGVQFIGVQAKRKVSSE